MLGKRDKDVQSCYSDNTIEVALKFNIETTQEMTTEATEKKKCFGCLSCCNYKTPIIVKLLKNY